MMKDIEALGFIQMTHRGIFSRSNDIKLTIEDGLKRCQQSSGGIVADTTSKGSHSETPEGTHSETLEGTHGESYGTHGETPHKDIRFKYQDLNLNTRETGTHDETPKEEEKAEFSDVAENRSMPTSGGAGSASETMLVGSQLDIEDLCLWRAFKEAFPSRCAWFQLVRAQNQLIMRGIGKMGDDMLDRAWDEVFGWFFNRGFHIVRASQNQRFNSEIVIKEAV